MQEFQRACSMGRYQGIDMAILSPEEARAKYPFLETHDMAGRLVGSDRWRHRPGATDAGPGQGRTRHGRDRSCGSVR